jgi:hypothetical protein
LSVLLRRLVRGLMRSYAETATHDPDPRLRGRTYAVPFEQVWQAAGRLASGGLRRWRLLANDDYEGVILAEWRTFIFRRRSDVVIHIKLDENAQTRVDMQCRSRKKGIDLGANARTIGRFFRALDQKILRPKA